MYDVCNMMPPLCCPRHQLVLTTIAQAMGQYPYPSSYILNGAGMLPAFPVRQACQALGKEGLDSDAALLSGLAGASASHAMVPVQLQTSCQVHVQR